ncbi:unnamed protein product [Paramecium pentaurelia]|uniref:Uncharacterized protein n=1 Tax=Paramecium pentaurelia TaxID=43138 RepID=A0A8S1X406_9CILI|nr:unnamed protein product [Paramecium pentaurelia]
MEGQEQTFTLKSHIDQQLGGATTTRGGRIDHRTKGDIGNPNQPYRAQQREIYQVNYQMSYHIDNNLFKKVLQINMNKIHIQFMGCQIFNIMNINQSQYSLENEKLKIKIKYLEDFIENSNNYEKTNQLFDLKQFLSKNYKRFSMLLDEIYYLKQQVEGEQMQRINEAQKLQTEINQLRMTTSQLQQQLSQSQLQLQQQQQQQIEESEHDVYRGSLNPIQRLEQIENLENTIKQLSDEIEEITQLNIKQREQLKKKDFFREYEMMCKETEGLRQQNAKLLDQLKAFNSNRTNTNSQNQGNINGF